MVRHMTATMIGFRGTCLLVDPALNTTAIDVLRYQIAAVCYLDLAE